MLRTNVSSFIGRFYKPSCKIQTNKRMNMSLQTVSSSLLLYLSYIKYKLSMIPGINWDFPKCNFSCLLPLGEKKIMHTYLMTNQLQHMFSSNFNKYCCYSKKCFYEISTKMKHSWTKGANEGQKEIYLPSL